MNTNSVSKNTSYINNNTNNNNKGSSSSSCSSKESLEPLIATMQKADDPFYSVRDNINSQIERIRIRYDRFSELIASCDTYTNIEFKELRKTVIKDIRTISQDAKGLQGAIDVIESKRSKFPHISDSELILRKQYVVDITNVINDFKSSIESPSVRRKIEQDENNARRSGYSDERRSTVNSIDQENSRFIGEQHQTTTNILFEQDMELSKLGNAVDRLGEIGRDVGQELKEQNAMLDKLDDDVDQANTRMEMVMGSLSKLLKSKDGCCMIYTIVILFLILVLLVALVIWT